MSFARLGFDLDWRRVARRAARLFAAHLGQVADTESSGRVVSSAFAWHEHFLDMALFEEIQASARRKGRMLKRTARASGRRVRGSVALACTPEGTRVQSVIDQLRDRLSAWEATALCG